jgi:hypothetical protein
MALATNFIRAQSDAREQHRKWGIAGTCRSPKERAGSPALTKSTTLIIAVVLTRLVGEEMLKSERLCTAVVMLQAGRTIVARSPPAGPLVRRRVPPCD